MILLTLLMVSACSNDVSKYADSMNDWEGRHIPCYRNKGDCKGAYCGLDYEIMLSGTTKKLIFPNATIKLVGNDWITLKSGDEYRNLSFMKATKTGKECRSRQPVKKN